MTDKLFVEYEIPKIQEMKWKNDESVKRRINQAIFYALIEIKDEDDMPDMDNFTIKQLSINYLKYILELKTRNNLSQNKLNMEVKCLYGKMIMPFEFMYHP